jgi:hypothetical protein
MEIATAMRIETELDKHLYEKNDLFLAISTYAGYAYADILKGQYTSAIEYITKLKMLADANIED